MTLILEGFFSPVLSCRRHSGIAGKKNENRLRRFGYVLVEIDNLELIEKTDDIKL